jgi:hypothetical protein
MADIIFFVDFSTSIMNGRGVPFGISLFVTIGVLMNPGQIVVTTIPLALFSTRTPSKYRTIPAFVAEYTARFGMPLYDLNSEQFPTAQNS